jgi:hypothetical protein
MITNHLLEETYRTQKRLVEESGYDMKKHSEIIRQMALDAQEKYGIQLKYGHIKGGTESLWKQSPSA